MLIKVRPLFCGCQPKQKVFVIAEDGHSQVMEADGRTPKVRFVDVSTEEMDCSENLRALNKLKSIIDDLASKNVFFNTLDDYPEMTKDSMLAWWEGFDQVQRNIMEDKDLRRPLPLSEESAPRLFAAFDSIVLRHQLDEDARRVWLTRQCSAAQQRRRQELVQTCQFSAASLNQNFVCPSTSTMEIAEYKDLNKLLEGVLPETPMARKHKPFLVLSCGTDPKAIDAFAGYFGPGAANKAKKCPLLWGWVCQLLPVV
jgi:hypothetical protein